MTDGPASPAPTNPGQILVGGNARADREEARQRTRAAVGVDGKRSSTTLREVRSHYKLSYYPLAALGLLYFVDQFQSYAFQVLAPDIGRTLGISIGAISAAIAFNAMAQAIAPMPIAALSQRRGVRALLCLATAFAWSVLTIFTGFVTSFLGLVTLLIMGGLATGSVTSLHAPLVMDSYPPAARVRAMSVYYTGGFFGRFGSPLFVAVLAGLAGLTWRGVFLVMGCTSIVITLFCLGLRDPGFDRWDTQRIRETVAEGRTTQPEAAAPATELRYWEILNRLLVIPTQRRIFACFLFIGALGIPLQTYLSFFLNQRWNLGPGERGLFFAYFSAVSAISLVLYGHRGEKAFRENPARLPLMTGIRLAIMVTFIAIAGAVPSFVGMIICFGIAGIANGPMVPALFISSLSIIPSRIRPHAQALTGIFYAIGGFTGALFFAGIDRRYGIDGALVSIAIPGFIAAAVIASAGRVLSRDLDHMIDEVVEDEEIAQVRSAGGKLPILSCRDIDFSYGQLQVLFKVDLVVDEGGMVALLGVNGAGKSTLLRVISGLSFPTSGSVRFRGENITFLDTERRSRLGIAQIHGGKAVFPPLTVMENLRCFGYTIGRDHRRLDAAIDECLDTFPQLAVRRNSLAATLSGGEQQMLALSRVLITKPRLLLIDELSLGLAPVTVGQLLEMVRRINSLGTAVVLVEQSVNIALSLVEHAYFMEKGEIRFDGPASDLLARDDLLRAVFLRGAAQGTSIVL